MYSKDRAGCIGSSDLYSLEKVRSRGEDMVEMVGIVARSSSSLESSAPARRMASTVTLPKREVSDAVSGIHGSSFSSSSSSSSPRIACKTAQSSDVRGPCAETSLRSGKISSSSSSSSLKIRSRSMDPAEEAESLALRMDWRSMRLGFLSKNAMAVAPTIKNDSTLLVACQLEFTRDRNNNSAQLDVEES